MTSCRASRRRRRSNRALKCERVSQLRVEVVPRTAAHRVRPRTRPGARLTARSPVRRGKTPQAHGALNLGFLGRARAPVSWWRAGGSCPDAGRTLRRGGEGREWIVAPFVAPRNSPAPSAPPARSVRPVPFGFDRRVIRSLMRSETVLRSVSALSWGELNTSTLAAGAMLPKAVTKRSALNFPSGAVPMRAIIASPTPPHASAPIALLASRSRLISALDLLPAYAASLRPERGVCYVPNVLAG
jgi:hypothetical protein